MTGEPVTGPGPGYARRRRHKAALSAGAAVVVLATGGVVAFSRLGSEPKQLPVAEAQRATAVVRRLDLVDHLVAIGSLGYGNALPLIGRKPGTLTWIATPGTVIGQGERIYAVDATPVTLFYGAAPMYRELALGVTPGEDVLILKRNLAALGYPAGTLDQKFQAATATALKRWQKALKVPETGRLQPTDVVVLAGSIRVAEVKAQLAATATSEVLTYSGTGKLVTVTIEESQRAYAKPESKVKVDVPGAGEAVATVREVAVSGESGQPKLTVTIALDDVGMAEKAEAGSVRVRFDGARRAGVLAVPVQALLALREGGYAVEVRHETGTRLIDVELGMFAGGLVEVSGPELAEGMQVVVAA